MADETPQTEAENPATAYQPPETVVTVYDADGREHYAAATSKFVVDGLADGTLTEQPPTVANSQGTPSSPQAGSSDVVDGEQRTEEVPSGAEVGSAGHDPEPGTGDGGDGSGDGEAEAGRSGGRRRTGTA